MSTEFIFFTKFKYQVESGRAAQCNFRGGDQISRDNDVKIDDYYDYSFNSSQSSSQDLQILHDDDDDADDNDYFDNDVNDDEEQSVIEQSVIKQSVIKQSV